MQKTDHNQDRYLFLFSSDLPQTTWMWDYPLFYQMRQLRFFWVSLVMLLGMLCNPCFSSTIETIAYSYAGNFKGWALIPDKPGKLPVIIYNYDEYFDWAGEKLANQKGYNIKNFMRTFEKWGYICIVPLERYHKANAIKGAIQYAESLPASDKTKIHIIGLSEGAFLSMLTVDSMPEVASVTLLAPMTIHYTGYYSIPEALKKMKKIKQPMLYMVGKEDRLWKLNITELIYKLLVQEKCKVTYKEYSESRRWFWDPTHLFMTDIYQFISQTKQTPEDFNPTPDIHLLQQELSFAH